MGEPRNNPTRSLIAQPSHFSVAILQSAHLRGQILQEGHIASHRVGQAAQSLQLYGEMRNEAVQATDLEGIPSTIDISRRDRNGDLDESHNQQSNTWNCTTSSTALADPLDARFRVHPLREFKFGRVFKVLWTEPARSEGTEITTVQGPTDYIGVRHYLIVERGKGHSLCVPILTQAIQGVRERGVHAEAHAVIYTSNDGGGKGQCARNLRDGMADKTENHDWHTDWWKCRQDECANRTVNSKTWGSSCQDCSDEESGFSEDISTPQQVETGRRLNYAKIYTVEHNIKVCFTGHMDKTNMERLLCGDPAWERSDTGEEIPVIAEDQPFPSFSCRCRRFQLLEKHAISNKMIALLRLSSGLLMSNSFVWLNKRMELYESSAIMNNIMDTGLYWIPNNSSEDKLFIPDGIIFALFFFGAAGLTCTTITCLKNSQCWNRFSLGMALAGVVASGMLGFSVQEIILVCLPLLIGCSIPCSSVLGWKATGSLHQEENVQSMGEV